ncbi:hypothetical protein BZG36_01792 [Bifiguratus adelaidae]|uniref:NADP-dependent oxidoreductase domain-containing protein n=1 Tax=Bifiguratus adelaidae TaxID=1938954 RepID=A0A261Y292_9FUNG|nr:hypothetical protein BZG36_01792 [Bifiguratus adelaidae]
MSLGRTFKLYTGATIPAIGLGTWLSEPGKVRTAVEVAIKTGYKHIDCAYVYRNEQEVGEAFANSKFDRKELFVTSKLWNIYHRPEYVRPAVEASLKNLKLDYLDLYLVHWPVAFPPPTDKPSEIPLNPTMEQLIPKKDGKVQIDQVDILQTWKSMEALVDAGLVKHIGLSNFNIQKIQHVLDHCRIRPAAIQVELHPGLLQDDLLAFCAKENIHVTAYSPLGNNVYGEERIVDMPEVAQVAKKLNKTPAQVCISWAAQRGTSVIPKSVTPSRIEENFQDFELSKDDFDAVSSLGRLDKRYNDPGRPDEWNVSIF